MNRRCLPLALATVLMATDGAARQPFEATYEIFFGGLRAADVALSVDWEGDRYAARTHVRARGLAAALLSTDARATAAGNGTARPQPETFRAEGRFGRSHQTVEMTFGGASPLPMLADPPLRERSYDPSPQSLRGALDPLSAAVAGLMPRPAARACDTVLPIFDSRRRYDLVIGPAARGDDGTLVCEGRFVRVSGFKRLSAGDFDAFTLQWQVDDAGTATLVRATVPTSWGTAVARLAR